MGWNLLKGGDRLLLHLFIPPASTLKVKVKSVSHVWLFVTPWTGACHAPLSMGFSRQEYWSGLSFPSPRDLPDPGTEPHLLCLLHWQVDSLRLAIWEGCSWSFPKSSDESWSQGCWSEESSDCQQPACLRISPKLRHWLKQPRGSTISLRQGCERVQSAAAETMSQVCSLRLEIREEHFHGHYNFLIYWMPLFSYIYQLSPNIHYQLWQYFLSFCLLVTKSCLFVTPMDCSTPNSSVHGILQARILEWVAISFSRGSCQPRN